jgi:hypothetical protein
MQKTQQTRSKYNINHSSPEAHYSEGLAYVDPIHHMMMTQTTANEPHSSHLTANHHNCSPEACHSKGLAHIVALA